MTSKGFSIAAVVNQINGKLWHILPTGLFFACGIFELERKENRVTAWCGGLPDAIVRRADGGIRHRIASTNLPLGVVEDLSGSDVGSLTLEVGDRLLAYSDGVIEARDPSGEMFGHKRLEMIFSESDDPACVFDDLSNAIVDLVEGEQQTDDITMVEILFDGDLPEDEPVQVIGGAVQVVREPTTWDASFEFGHDALRSVDPLPMLVQVPMEIQGLGDHRQRLYTVFAELFRNALDHGLLGLDSALKETPEGFTEFYSQREERLAALSEGTIRIQLRHEPRASGGRLIVCVEDSGAGFDYPSWREVQGDSSAKSGRGIALVRALCEDLVYRADGKYVEATYAWETE